MKIYMEENVFDAAIKRINRIFDDFENIVVSFSGGKDSTVCLELCLAVARQRNRLPLKVLFIDQEIEWQHTIDYVRRVMSRPDVEPIWLQMPMKIFNATSHDDEWLWCWEDGGNWMREKEPCSIKENTFGTMRFHEIFGAVQSKMFDGKDCANIGGVRGEETPKRVLACTSRRCWKDITYGHIDKWEEGHAKITFYPLYDWSYRDVWKFIFDNKCDYNGIYNFMYAKGVPMSKMRVSNLNHETALKSLSYLQELEPDTWNKAVDRLNGVNTEKHCSVEKCVPSTYPPMFDGWNDYVLYLIDNLVKEEHRIAFRNKYLKLMLDFEGHPEIDGFAQTFVKCIILDDYYFTTIENVYTNPKHRAWLREKHNAIVSEKQGAQK